ncbi:hypothetical protein RKD20_003715 [Streptomyces sp. SLBN-8D4]
MGVPEGPVVAVRVRSLQPACAGSAYSTRCTRGEPTAPARPPCSYDRYRPNVRSPGSALSSKSNNARFSHALPADASAGSQPLPAR